MACGSIRCPGITWLVWFFILFFSKFCWTTKNLTTENLIEDLCYSVGLLSVSQQLLPVAVSWNCSPPHRTCTLHFWCQETVQYPWCHHSRNHRAPVTHPRLWDSHISKTFSFDVFIMISRPHMALKGATLSLLFPAGHFVWHCELRRSKGSSITKL